MKRLLLSILILSALAVFPACGRGGGGAVPTQAIVKISTTGTLTAGTQIGGIEMTLDLPAGVSVKATPDTTNPAVLVTDGDVLSVSGESIGEFAGVTGTYNAASNAVALYLLNPDGFGTGEFVTVTCDIEPGTTVTAADFGTGTLSVKDLSGASISGLTAGFTVELR